MEDKSDIFASGKLANRSEGMGDFLQPATGKRGTLPCHLVCECGFY